MRTLRRALFSLVLGLALVTVPGCIDGPGATEPIVEQPSEGLLGGLLGLGGGNQPVDVLERTTPLAATEVVSDVIGPFGGIIHLPNAGLVVRVPLLALRQPTTITVTAPAGDLVGYHFQPHGLQFRRDVILLQDLSDTEASALLGLGKNLQAAYFQGPLTPVVNALELLSLDIFGAINVGRFKIDHFSGYVIATD